MPLILNINSCNHHLVSLLDFQSSDMILNDIFWVLAPERAKYPASVVISGRWWHLDDISTVASLVACHGAAGN